MRFEWTFDGLTAADGAAQILSIWAGEGFYADLATELHLDGHEVVIDEGADALTTRQRLTFSTRNIPEVFRRLLGVAESMTVEWLTEIAKLRSPDGTMTATSGDKKLRFDAKTSMRPDGDGRALWVVDGPVRLSAPWPVRSTAEDQLAKLLRSVLTDQAKVTGRWLEGAGRSDKA